jgi:hypothetical protein
MTDEQKAAYVIADAVSALIEALGMTAENTIRQRQGKTLAYGDKAFYDVIDQHCLGYNKVAGLFNA